VCSGIKLDIMDGDYKDPASKIIIFLKYDSSTTKQVAPTNIGTTQCSDGQTVTA
jgi:hypothetical protein